MNFDQILLELFGVNLNTLHQYANSILGSRGTIIALGLAAVATIFLRMIGSSFLLILGIAVWAHFQGWVDLSAAAQYLKALVK